MDHAVIGGVVAVVVFAVLCLLIVLGRYFARHKGKWCLVLAELHVFSDLCPRRRLTAASFVPSGTYFTHEAKGADDAADADTAIINAEGGHTSSEEKKEYYI